MDQLWVVKEKSPQLQVFWPEQFLKCLVWSMEGPSRMVQMVMNLPATQETQVRFLGWEDIWRKEWLPTQVFLPREFHGQRSLAGYSPCGCKELDNWATNTFFVCAFFFFVLVLSMEEWNSYQLRWRRLPEKQVWGQFSCSVLHMVSLRFLLGI